jgi:glycosyltransferase involved in cell wall biosynthesis
LRILYADPAVLGFGSHHATSVLALPEAFRNLGHKVIVAGHADVLPEMRERTGALPAFRAFTYTGPSTDPMSGWLTNFLWARDATLEDLAHLWRDRGPFDLVYFNSARAAQVAALGLWLRQLSDSGLTTPPTVIELAIEAGLTQTNPGTYGVRNRGIAVLFRHCREWLGDDEFGQLTFVAGCRQAVDEYDAIFFSREFDGSSIQAPRVNSGAVHLAPMPQPLPLPRLRTRPPENGHSARKSLTVGFLGHQRPDKGYHMLPAVIQQVLHAFPDVRILVQHSDPGSMRSTTDEIDRLAHDGLQVELILRPFVEHEWFALLDRCDIIALPYTRNRFETSASAILGEALASGAPVVVPGGTVLSSVVDELRGPGTTFATWEPPSIAGGIAEAIHRFDDLAERAFEAGRIWRERHGPDRFARAVLALAAERAAQPSRALATLDPPLRA